MTLVSCGEAPPIPLEAEGTVREQLAQIADQLDRYRFPADRMSKFVEERPESARAWLRLGIALLREGRADEGIEALERASGLIDSAQDPVDPAFSQKVSRWLGTGYMRRGEYENCQLNHNPARCLIPIEGEGVHTALSGSEGAVVELEKCWRPRRATGALGGSSTSRI